MISIQHFLASLKSVVILPWYIGGVKPSLVPATKNVQKNRLESFLSFRAFTLQPIFLHNCLRLRVDAAISAIWSTPRSSAALRATSSV